MSGDSWAQRLYQTLRHYLPWPYFVVCTPPLVVAPLDTDDDIDFYNDTRYLFELQRAILDEIPRAKADGPDTFIEDTVKPLLAAVTIPIESQRFWDAFGEWPADHAGELLSIWRFDNELSAYMEAREPDEQAA